MREEEFRIWAKNSLQPDSVNSYTYYIKKIADTEGINIDDEFDKDELENLIERYRYAPADAPDKGLEPIKLIVAESSLGDYRSILNKYKNFRLEVGDTPIFEEQKNNLETQKNSTAEDRKTIIDLEKHLQAALRKNIAQLDPDLKIIDGGKEHRVYSGSIDILAQDKNGCYVIIELKAGTALGDVIGQTLGYMADIANEKEQTKENVRGIIVAGDFHKRVRSAARMTPEVELISYSYIFNFDNETPDRIN